MRNVVMLGVVGLIILASTTAAALADPAVGWRTDGTGQYPSAEPPAEWGPDKNVVWKTPMPSWSNATPVIVGDRIFVCSEPADLICINKADGKVLWTKSNAFADYMTDQDKAQAKEDKVKADAIRKDEIGPVVKQIRDIEKDLSRLAAAAKTTQPDGKPMPAEEVKKQSAPLREKLAGLNKQKAEIEAKLAPFTKWEPTPTQESNGHSSATPVSDGQVVCVVFNTGTVACYDLDGNRKWIRLVEKCIQGSNWGNSASPVLADGKLIVHLRNLRALDLADGKELWSVEDTTYHWGTPVVARIGEITALITELGDVVRASDGKLLVKRLCSLVYNSPVFHDNVAYFIQAPGKAVKLTAKSAEEVTAEPLWTAKPKSDRYYSSPIVTGGLAFNVTQANVFSVIDAATGEVVKEKTLELGKGTVYPSLALAGRWLFASSDTGTTAVIEPGREVKVIATNTLEKFRASPVFEGKRLYIRTMKHLYCIGQ